MTNILISAVYFQKDYEQYKDRFKGQVDLPEVKEKLTESELLRIIDKYDYVLCGDDQFTPKVIDRARKLKKIIKWGTGIDAIDVKYAESKGIPVFNSPNAFTEPVSDTVLGMMLAFARRLLDSDRLVKQNRWKKLEGYTLGEKNLGIIGMGNIGKATAQKAQALGMRVLGYDIKPVDTKAEMVDLNTLLEKSDFLSLSCDLNSSSYHLITLKELEKFGGIVINTARGAVIKQDDLIEALEGGIIKGAGLDVYEEEPLPESKLRNLNTILSPHNANNSSLYYKKVHENCINLLNADIK